VKLDDEGAGRAIDPGGAERASRAGVLVADGTGNAVAGLPLGRGQRGEEPASPVLSVDILHYQYTG
jgi:hypothetical protein